MTTEPLRLILDLLGLAVVVVVAAVACARAWRWTRLHLFRRSPLKFQVMNLSRVWPRLEQRGWDLKFGGAMLGKHLGVGWVWGSPPTFTCESCHRTFKTEDECIDHEKEMAHGDYAQEPA